MKIIKKYLILIIAVIVLVLMFVWNKSMALNALGTIKISIREMLLILPPVFVLLGLLDIWVPRDTMVKFMGEGSGLLGAFIAFVIGSSAAGPLYVVFPIAAAFMNKGTSFINILILIGAWSTTKIPMLLFEYGSLGPSFMLTRLALNIPIILVIAFTINKAMKKEEIDSIYETAKNAN